MKKGKPPIIADKTKFFTILGLIILLGSSIWIGYESATFVDYDEIIILANKYNGLMTAKEGRTLSFRHPVLTQEVGMWKKNFRCDLFVDTVFNDGETAVVKMGLQIPIDAETAINLSKEYTSRTDFYVRFLQAEITKSVHKISISMSSQENYTTRRAEFVNKVWCLTKKALKEEGLTARFFYVNAVLYDNFEKLVRESEPDC